VEVDEVNVAKFEIKFWELKLVIVVEEIVPVARVNVPVAFRFVVAKLEVVAEVIVALTPKAFVKLVVVAFVVEAFRVRKLAVVPHNVVIVANVDVKVLIVAVVKFAKKANKFVEVEFVMEAFVEKKLVEVELEIVEFVVSIPKNLIVFANKLVTLAFVNVAFTELKFVNRELEANKFVVVVVAKVCVAVQVFEVEIN
jgi:hypothetical protein